MEKKMCLPVHSLLGVESIVRKLIFLCAFLVIAYCIWMLDRGFELTDEAYYLLLAMYADSVKFYISAQQWITAGLWQFTGNIMVFRASGMVILLTSSALLAFGVFSAGLRLNLVADRFELKWVVFAGSVVGAMLYASTINLSPSYNLLASAGAYTAAGMVLLASHSSSIAHKYVFYVLAGCGVGVEALCRASAGVSTLALLVLWVGIFENTRFGKIFGLVAMILGAVSFACTALLVNTTISEATQAFQEGMQLFRMVQVEPIMARLIRYSMQFGEYFLASLRAFAIPITAMIIYATTHRGIFAKLGLVALLITLVIDRHLFGGWNADGSFTSPIAVFVMLVMALIVSIPVWNKNRCTLALFLGLTLLPYSVAMGTGNILFTQVVDSLAPWGVLIAVLLVADHRDDFNKMITSVIGLCFMTTITLNIITSGIWPYHLSSSLAKQDQTIVVGNLGKVKVDEGTYRFISDLKAAARNCDIKQDAPFIGLYNIPGVALVFESIPLLSPWLNNKEQADFIIGRMSQKDLNSAIIAFKLDGNGAFPLLPKQLVEFPLGYRNCGMATYPYMRQSIQIWYSQVK